VAPDPIRFLHFCELGLPINYITALKICKQYFSLESEGRVALWFLIESKGQRHKLKTKAESNEPGHGENLKPDSRGERQDRQVKA